MEYVLGFVFDLKCKKVLLIQKQKPTWQRGRFNGIGGKIEPKENPLQAMVRECEEETGLLIENWKYLGVLEGDQPNPFTVHLFAGNPEHTDIESAVSMEEEEVFIFPVGQLPDLVLSNIRWLVPYAIDCFTRNNNLRLHAKYREIY